MEEAARAEAEAAGATPPGVLVVGRTFSFNIQSLPRTQTSDCTPRNAVQIGPRAARCSDTDCGVAVNKLCTHARTHARTHTHTHTHTQTKSGTSRSINSSRSSRRASKKLRRILRSLSVLACVFVSCACQSSYLCLCLQCTNHTHNHTHTRTPTHTHLHTHTHTHTQTHTGAVESARFIGRRPGYTTRVHGRTETEKASCGRAVTVCEPSHAAVSPLVLAPTSSLAVPGAGLESYRGK